MTGLAWKMAGIFGDAMSDTQLLKTQNIFGQYEAAHIHCDTKCLRTKKQM